MKRIYARKTSVEMIELKVAQDFVNKYHRQGAAIPLTKIRSIGLFYDGELVAVSQFCHPRTEAKKREYTNELLRMCFKDGVRVVGGASKMVDFFKEKCHPADIFTYQDRTGENTNVYEHCGFVKTSHNSTKSYLVAPGKTLATADQKKNEVLTMAYAVQRGPDAVLGTNIGEKFHEDGRRFTNIELFQSLGWTIESTIGDAVWEWIDPNVTFYTYKITATDSDKYYYGVSHVNIGSASFEQCLNDGYMGSGGASIKNNKFANWKKKHKSTLHKEVLRTFDRKPLAYAAEKELVGNKYNTDPLCLNSIRGGAITGDKDYPSSARFTIKNCPIHGDVTHNGRTCTQCQLDRTITVKNCDKHGDTKHIGEQCYKCVNESSISMKNCPVHGLSKHNGNTCCQCVNEQKLVDKECPVHGLSKHFGDACHRCSMESIVSIQECPVHGLSSHQSGTCRKCVVENIVAVQECHKHGLVKHIGGSCATCIAQSAVTVGDCEIHGSTKFTGETCRRCLNASKVSVKLCPVHGESKHIGGKCFKCRKNSVVLGDCPVHGETSFVGTDCLKCKSAKRAPMKSRVCSLCGKDFVPTSSRQKICQDEHLMTCPGCGVEFPYKRRKTYCSPGCMSKSASTIAV